MNPYERETERTRRTEDPRSGGDPQTVGHCTECGTIYPVQRTQNGSYRPIGTDGTCTCGNAELEPHDELEL